MNGRMRSVIHLWTAFAGLGLLVAEAPGVDLAEAADEEHVLRVGEQQAGDERHSAGAERDVELLLERAVHLVVGLKCNH